MKQLEVQIMGQSYLLGCPDGGDSRLLEAVERVDTAMCRIRDGGKVRARDRIAVLAALNLAFDLADRPAPADASTVPPHHADTMNTGPAPLHPPEETAPASAKDVVLSSLLTRLDHALGDDGRLL
jgi:cell division protein ZapA